MKLQKIKIYIETETTFEEIQPKILFLYLISISVKFRFWQIFIDIVENKNSYWKKCDL